MEQETCGDGHTPPLPGAPAGVTVQSGPIATSEANNGGVAATIPGESATASPQAPVGVPTDPYDEDFTMFGFGC
jgi:hypothetical protein